MKMLEFSEYLGQLEKTASRNLMTEILADMFTSASAEEVRVMGYMTLGGLRPKFDRLETQLAEKMVVRGITELYCREAKEVWALYKKLGDLGEAAYQLSTRRPETRNQQIAVMEVYKRLVEIASESGAGSQERKLNKLMELLKSLDPLSVKYVTRMVVGKLRLGFSDMTLLDAMSVMDRGSKAGREEIERAYQVYPDVGELLKLVKKQGALGLGQRVRLNLGVPVVPALCQRLKTADEMVAKMGRVLAEPKFDGTRVQIHYRRGKVKTFSRTLDETTWMFPELVDIGKQIKAEEVILDAEAVGVDPKTGKWLPFQETITRKRKHDIANVSVRVPLKFMVFDLLAKDGISMLTEPLVNRRRILEQTIEAGSVLAVTEAVETDSAEKLREYHAKKLTEGIEGVVVKKADSVYEPGRRGWSWVKFKEAETSQAKLSDTIDALVMGFYRGKGKRTQFGIGAFLVGVQENVKAKKSNVKTENEILTIAKIGTGLTDEQWKELRRRLEEAVAVDKPVGYLVPDGLTPDVWTEPKVVVEVAADEVTKSPVHSAGVALRFPRLVRFREDKDVATATTLAEVKQIGMG